MLLLLAGEGGADRGAPRPLSSLLDDSLRTGLGLARAASAFFLSSRSFACLYVSSR